MTKLNWGMIGGGEGSQIGPAHRLGARADGNFVLAAGAARVLRSGNNLARLQPGDLFGEDALITGEPRNASVQMETDGQVMALSALHFRDFLVSSLLEGIYAVEESAEAAPAE